MTRRARAAIALSAALALAALALGVALPRDLVEATSLALLVLALALGAGALILLKRVVAMQRRARTRHAMDAKAQRHVRVALREIRRQQRHTHRLLKDVRAASTEQAASARATKAATARIAPLEAQVSALRKDVAALRTPPPKPPLTGQDSTAAGTRMLNTIRRDGESPAVVLLLQSFGAHILFAGIRTAVIVAAETARELDRPLRVVVFDALQGRPDDARVALAELISAEVSAGIANDLQLTAPNYGSPGAFHREDIWIATYWTTAWNLAELARDGRVDRRNVVYLVQDWEPGFFPWGDLRTKAESTYGAGFQLLVNSASLARYVADQTGVPVPDARVFAPQLDPQPLREAAKRWSPSIDRELRVLFYARPSKPRNMFNLGLQTLRAWADQLPETTAVTVRLAGEQLGAVDLGPRIRSEALGKVTYDDYYDLLAETDLGLALMSSPHPGHLALELPMAGIPTVTNPFDGYRTSWVDGLVVADSPDVPALVNAMNVAASSACDPTTHVPADAPSTLGASLTSAVRAVCADLRRP